METLKDYGIKKLKGGKLEDLKKFYPWILKANIDLAELSITENILNFDHGVWLGGVWEEGIWLGGSWYGGVWLEGKWMGGVWHGGIWHDGVWEDGEWQGGAWRDGTWLQGKWMGGVWRNGVWRNGVWCGGFWEGGAISSDEPPNNYGICNSCGLSNSHKKIRAIEQNAVIKKI